MTREEMNKRIMQACERTWNEEICEEVIQTLKEPKAGRWINTADPYMSDNIVCSECGYDSIASYKYCPNCGAKMETV